MHLTLQNTAPRGTIQTMQHQAQPTNLPLGTAEWMTFPPGTHPTFSPGDLFLGYAQDGRAAGSHDRGHVGIIAKTRAGKGAGFIVPNIIAWPANASLVVIDIKGENAVLTARRRAGGSRYCVGLQQNVYILDPFGDVHTDEDDFSDLKAHFNPLDVLGADRPESVPDADSIAESIVSSEEAVSDPFWNDGARSLIKAVCLHVSVSRDYRPEDRHLISVRDLIMEGYAELRAMLAANDPNGKAPSAYALLFRAMKKNKAYGGELTKLGERFARMEANAPRLLESIAQVACTHMDFLGNAQMASVVTRSSFALADLKNDPKGVCIYLCLPQRFMETHFRFLRMMVNLILAEMQRIKHQPVSGYPVLMILDEFPALNRMRSIENACAQIAGHGVQLAFIAQTINQLKTVYKENWETLLNNCTTKLFFGNEGETAEYVSKLCGDVETIRRTNSQSASQGQSNSEAHGETLGQSTSRTQAHSVSWNAGGQGSSASGSISVSHTDGQSLSRSATSTFGHNQSNTLGVSETLHKRALVTPDEVRRYFGDPSNPLSLVVQAGQQPLALRRASYFNEDQFAGLYDPHPDHPKPLTLPQIVKMRKQVRLEAQQALIAKQEREKERQEKAAAAKARAFWAQERIAHQRAVRKQEREERRAMEMEANRRFWLWFAILVAASPVALVTSLSIFAAFLTGKPVVAHVMWVWMNLFA